MQCWGRTKAGRRCQKPAKFIFCHLHRRQSQLFYLLLSILTIIGLFAGLYQDLVKPIFVKEDSVREVLEKLVTVPFDEYVSLDNRLKELAKERLKEAQSRI
jgi:hypothetical protein